MKFKKAANIDLYLGRPLLKILSFFPPWPQDLSNQTGLKNILIIKCLGMGSILEATPLLTALKKNYPGASIDILTFTDNRQLVENLNLFDRVHTIKFNTNFFHFIGQTLKFIARHRKTYSLVLDLEFFSSYTAFLTKMLGSRLSLGFEGFITARNRCYSRTVIFDHSSHVRVVFLKFLDALGIGRPQNPAITRLRIGDKQKKAVMSRLPALQKTGLKIAININSSDLCLKRRWPAESFRTLITLLKDGRHDLQVFLTGAAHDLSYVNAFYDSLPGREGVHVTAGQLDILELGYLLTETTCLVSNDSGPVHIAESLEVPVVCFFGPETPHLYGPLSTKSKTFYKNLFCSPCLNIYGNKKSTCRNNLCLRKITPLEVYEGMQPLLADWAGMAA